MVQLPDLARAAALLKISVDLENTKPDSILGYSILQGLRDGRLREVIRTISSQARDNRELMADIIGEELLQRIEKYLSHSDS